MIHNSVLRLVVRTHLMVLFAFVVGCTKKAPEQQQNVPEVDVAHAVVRQSVEWDEYTGRLGAVESVEVRPRVTGYVEKVHFKAGQIVKKGDLLFTIDPRPFAADLDRAKAAVKRFEAEVEHAQYDLQRIVELQKNQASAEKEYRDVVFAEQSARAELDSAKSEERVAALNVEWSSVVAPVAGRVSRELVTSGNLVHDGSTGSTLLTTIVSLDPIYCYFDADEQSYLKYARMSQSGERASSRDKPNPVRVALFDETEFVHEGHMDFVDNAMDQLTGTLRARAVLPNQDGLLIPGLFVRVRLIGSGVRPMVYIPDSAVVADLTTRFAYIVDDKNIVRARPVRIGRLQNGLRRVLSGLDGSETIVVHGVQRIRPETLVKPNPVTACEKAWMPDSAATTTQPASLTATMPSAGGAP